MQRACGCVVRVERFGLEAREVLVQACAKHARLRGTLEGRP